MVNASEIFGEEHFFMYGAFIVLPPGGSTVVLKVVAAVQSMVQMKYFSLRQVQKPAKHCSRVKMKILCLIQSPEFAPEVSDCLFVLPHLSGTF